MRRTWIRLLAALAVWTAVFALCLGLGRRGLTLYFEIPPEATDVSFRFAPEGVVRVAEQRVSADGSELAVHFEALRRGSCEALVIWGGVGDGSFYDREIRMELRSLPLGVLSDSITWNFTGWGCFTVCLSLFLFTAAGIFFAASSSEAIAYPPPSL